MQFIFQIKVYWQLNCHIKYLPFRIKNYLKYGSPHKVYVPPHPSPPITALSPYTCPPHMGGGDKSPSISSRPRESPAPMDDIVKSCRKWSVSVSLTGNPGRPFKILQNSGIPQNCETSRLWNPSKTAVVLLGNPEIFGYPIQCRPWGRGRGIFSGIAHWSCNNIVQVWPKLYENEMIGQANTLYFEGNPKKLYITIVAWATNVIVNSYSYLFGFSCGS